MSVQKGNYGPFNPTERARARAELSGPVLDQLGKLFTECLPRIEAWGPLACRGARQEDERQERMAELRGRAWQSFLAMARAGKSILPGLNQLARNCALAALSKRSLSGGFPSHDPFHERARARGITRPVSCILIHASALSEGKRAARGEMLEASLEEALATAPGEDVATRAQDRDELRQWARTLPRTKRRVAFFLAKGNSPARAAEHFHLSRPRITQIRLELYASWHLFRCRPI